MDAEKFLMIDLMGTGEVLEFSRFNFNGEK